MTWWQPLTAALAKPHQPWCSCLVGSCDCGHDVSAARAANAEREALRDWQRDLLTPDADGRTLDQVVANLIGVKSIALRPERDDDGNDIGTDRRWRVQYFGGTYGGELVAALIAAAKPEGKQP